MDNKTIAARPCRGVVPACSLSQLATDMNILAFPLVQRFHAVLLEHASATPKQVNIRIPMTLNTVYCLVWIVLAPVMSASGRYRQRLLERLVLDSLAFSVSPILL